MGLGVGFLPYSPPRRGIFKKRISYYKEIIVIDYGNNSEKTGSVIMENKLF